MIDLSKAAQSLTGLSLPKRRAVLQTMFNAGRLLGQFGEFGLAPTFVNTLRISAREAARLDRDFYFHDMLQAMEWLVMSSTSRAHIERDISYVRFQDPGLLERLSATKSPVILSPLHMGAFPTAMAATVHTYFRDRKVLILRAKEDNATNIAAMSRLTETSAGLRVLNVFNKADYVDALRYARDGALVISFIDLPASYGSPQAVTLFNAPASIALGIESLARVIKGCVVPMAVTSSTGSDLVKIGTPFEVSENCKGERQRIAARIARDIEQFVYDNPAQWHMWPRLHEFRALDVTEEAQHAA